MVGRSEGGSVVVPRSDALSLIASGLNGVRVMMDKVNMANSCASEDVQEAEMRKKFM